MLHFQTIQSGGLCFLWWRVYVDVCMLILLSPLSVFCLLKPSPLSCRGRGFDFVQGPAEPAPGYNLHPFESRSPRGGVNEPGPVQMSGVSGKFFRLMKRQRMAGKDYCGPAVPGQQDGLCLSQPGEWTQTGDTEVPGERSRHPPQRRRARARSGVALGVPAALSPAR